MNIKILVVDDHRFFRSSFINFLTQFLVPTPVCVEAENGREALAELTKVTGEPFDLVFLDVNMPEMNGVETYSRMRKEFPDIRVIVCTSFEDERLVAHFRELGAHAFLAKNEINDEIQILINQVLSGIKFFPATVQEDAFKETKDKLSNLELSHQEKRLIQMLQGGYSSKEIANLMGLALKTVDAYRKRLLTKTKTRNVAELIALGFKVGILR